MITRRKIASIVLLLVFSSCTQQPSDILDAGVSNALDTGSSIDAGARSDAGPAFRITLDAQENEAIDAYLTGQMERLGLVGMAAAVVVGQKIEYLKAWGFADREQGIQASPRQTVWRLASLSKGVTGVIATRLAQRQVIDLQANLPNLEPEFPKPTRYLPSNCEELSCSRLLADGAPELTLDLLLHHRGGVVHYTNGLGNPSPPQELADNPEHNTGMRWSISYLAGQPLLTAPGARFSYTSFGYNLAGAAIEALTGESFDALLRREVAEPAQAPSLQVERVWQPIDHAAAVYSRSGQAMQRGDRADISWKAAGGGLVATVEDLARYCGALIHRQLTGAARDTMLWSVRPDDNYAHGFALNEEHQTIEHTGAQQGARTGLLIEPNTERCFVVMTNTEAGNGGTWTRGMAERWR